MKKTLFFLFLVLSFTDHYATQIQDTLRIGVYDSPPFVIYNEDGSLEGVSVWLWDKMKYEIQQPYTIVKYSNEEPLQAILNDLDNGTIDFSINPLTITSARHERIDFSHPFYIGNLTIAKKSTSDFGSWFSSVREFFNNRVLLLILTLAGMVVVFGLIIWLVEKKNHHFERGIQGLLTSFWWSAVTMTTVGYGDKVPISHLGRFVAFVWMLCSLIIISIFTASITSTLTVKQLADNDISLNNFKEKNTGTVKASATEAYLKRNFFRKVNAYPEFLHGLNGLKNDEVDLFVYDEPWLAYQLHNNPEYASLEILPIRFNMQLYAMPMRKNLDHDFKNKISSSMLRIRETKDWELILDEYHMKQY